MRGHREDSRVGRGYSQPLSIFENVAEVFVLDGRAWVSQCRVRPVFRAWARMAAGLEV
jgi:hypothetical protein